MGIGQRLPFANNMALASTWLWRHFAVARGSVYLIFMMSMDVTESESDGIRHFFGNLKF